MSRWKTEGVVVDCVSCGWSADPKLRDKLGAGRRHKAKHPDHVVLASREQAKTIILPRRR